MKKLILTIKDFLQFRQVCELYRIKFTYGYKPGGQVTVQANAYDLDIIGY